MKNIIYVFVLIGAMGLSACLKEDKKWGPDAPGYVSSVIELSDMASVTSESSSTFPRWTFAFDPEEEVVLDVLVNYAGTEVAPEDITVKLVLDYSIIDTFNKENGTKYIAIPESWFQLPNDGIVTIKKGEKTATIPVNVKLGQFKLTESYGLPIKIASASQGTISGNFSAGIFAVSPKSVLDGTFANAYDASVGSGSNTQTFTTVSPLIVTSGWLGLYSNLTTIYLDPENPNQVSEVTVANLGGASIEAGTLDPATNYYDPETETLYLNYDLLPGSHYAVQTLKKQ